MDLEKFGERLQILRKQRGLSQEQLVELLDQRARGGSANDYRVIDATLVSRWERAKATQKRQWRPTRVYVGHLLQIFADALDVNAARQWARQADYQFSDQELSEIFRARPIENSSPPTGSSSATPARHNLPMPLTSFIGRESEVQDLAQRLQAPNARLITLAGEGGVGKTRIALAVAQRLANSEHFSDGVWFVPLAGVDLGAPNAPAEPLATAIAKALNFVFASADVPVTAQLIGYLRPKCMLLLLDNMEHLMPALPFVLELLQHAPGIQILATSRLALNTLAEQVLPVDGLPALVEAGLARAEAHMSATAMQTLPSVRLFVERAGHHLGQNMLGANQLRDVALLCQMVNGNPLAVELAAHWVQHYSVAEMIDALKQRDFSWLSTDAGDLPLRQRSINAVFNTTWQLLSVECQRVFAQLSVFRGPFSREAALQVTGCKVADLATLVNYSLLHVRREISGQRHYVMHELLRQLAANSLAQLDAVQPGLQNAAHARHSDYYLRLLGARGPLLYGNKNNGAQAEIDAEIDNARAAWRWAVGESKTALLSQAWLGLRTYYHVRSLYQEGEEAFRSAALAISALLAQGAPETHSLWLDLCAGQAFFLGLLHQYEQAVTLLMNLLTDLEDRAPVLAPASAPAPTSLARLHLELGNVLSLQGKNSQALPHLNEAIARARRWALPAMEARAQYALARVWIGSGDYARAEATLQEALRCYQRVDYLLPEAFVLSRLGNVALLQNRCAEALNYLEQALRIYQDAEDQARLASMLAHLGAAHAELGDLGRALGYYRTSYEQREVVQDQRHIAATTEGLSKMLARLGDFPAALAHAEEALALQQTLGSTLGVIDALCTRGYVQIQTQRLSTALDTYREALGLMDIFGLNMRRAEALLGYSRALAGLGFANEAEVSARQALELYRQAHRPHELPEAWNELARIALLNGHLAQALEMTHEVLAALKLSPPNKTDLLLPIYWVSYQVLRANHDPRAGGILAEVCELLEALANTIEDDRLRQSFLSQVPANREIKTACRG